MSELLVVSFQNNVYRASGVVDELRVLDDRWILDLADAVAVHRDANWLVTMDQFYQPTGRQTAEWGSMLGLLIAISLAVPLITNACPTVAEGARIGANLARAGVQGVDGAYWNDLLDIPEEFLHSAYEAGAPGNSLIYVVLEASAPALAADRFRSYGGIITRFTIGRSQQDRIQEVLRRGATSLLG